MENKTKQDESGIQIALIEPTKSAVKGIKEFYTNIFSSFGFKTVFHLIDPSPKNYSGNKSIFLNKVIDIFITDLSLGSKENYDGLEIISNVKRTYPDVLVIANSRTNINYLDTADRIPSFDLFVHKRKMDDEKYTNYVKYNLSRLFKKNVYLTIDFEKSDIKDYFKKESDKVLLKNILRSITFNSIYANERTSVTKVILKRIEGGMSKSRVYRLYGYTNNLPCINTILKFSLRQDAEIERNNYLNYVKWYLPYNWRPEILATAFWNKLGCICYSYAFNDEISFDSLTYFIKQKDLDTVNNAIKYILNPDFKTWYHTKNVSTASNVTKYYQKKWFENRSHPDKKVSKFISSLKSPKISSPNSNIVRIENEDYYHPGVYLLGQPRGEYFTCISHGDLSSNNILIAGKEQISFIDFQDTGIGHIFEDFVSMELSLRLYFQTELDFIQLLKLEEDLIDSTFLSNFESIVDPQYAIGHTVFIIRNAAFKSFFPNGNFSSENVKNYLFALAVSTFGMMRKDSLQEWQKNQVLALCFAATKKLSELEENEL